MAHVYPPPVQASLASSGSRGRPSPPRTRPGGAPVPRGRWVGPGKSPAAPRLPAPGPGAPRRSCRAAPHAHCLYAAGEHPGPGHYPAGSGGSHAAGGGGGAGAGGLDAGHVTGERAVCRGRQAAMRAVSGIYLLAAGLWGATGARPATGCSPISLQEGLLKTSRGGQPPAAPAARRASADAAAFAFHSPTRVEQHRANKAQAAPHHPQTVLGAILGAALAHACSQNFL